MTILGLDHQHQVILTIVLIVVFFAFLAKLDFVLGPREYMEGVEYHLPFITVSAHWFWMWIIGYPLIGVAFAFTYYFGALDTERNMWYALGLFATVIMFAVGQLEDFFFHVVNPEVSWIPASQDWSYWGWSAENNLCWRIFGTWNTPLHLIWFSCFMVAVAVMWWAIFEYA